MQQLNSPGHTSYAQAAPISPVPVPPSTDPSDMLLRMTMLGAEDFKDVFYTVYDSKRVRMPEFFGEKSTLIWNGHLCPRAQMPQLFEMVPVSHHDILSLDAQPIMPGSSDGGSSILITVTGTVRYSLDQPIPFQEVIVLERLGADLTSPYFVNSCVRRDNVTKHC